jgi:hypothetical protein
MLAVFEEEENSLERFLADLAPALCKAWLKSPSG